jgi:hypothetical protein
MTNTPQMTMPPITTIEGTQKSQITQQDFTDAHQRQQVLSTNGVHLMVPLFDGAHASAPRPELFDIRPLFTQPSGAARQDRARDKLEGLAITAYNELPVMRKGFSPAQMVLLITDLDAGNLTAEQVTAMVQAFYGDSIASTYSTASSRPEAKRWRIVVPLAAPVDVQTWLMMQRAFAEFMRLHGIAVDASMNRATQLSFTPNVPRDARDPFTFEPLHFEHRFWGTALFDPSNLTAEAQNAMQIIREFDADEAAQREESRRKAAEREAQRQQALASGGDGLSPVDRFNATHDTAALMVTYGYAEDPHNPGHWRSPMQTSPTFATLVHEDGSWHSLSGSDATAGLGRPSSKGGRFGSAFDLFVHFEHRGNFARAVASQSPSALPSVDAFAGVPEPLTSLFSRGTESRYSSSGDGKGYTASRANIETALLDDDMCHRVGFDKFKCEVMICEPGESKWRPLKEVDAFNVAVCLERKGFKSLPRETLRDAIHAVAERNSFDTAQAWLNGLQWDGVPRVGQFIAKGFGAAESAYATAIGDYVWSALAGRILEPGCKADMVPIAVGPQGCRKSSAVAAMSPKAEFFAELDLSLDEADLFRCMKGKLVLELGELAGMRRKEAEHLKRFVAATTNNWVEKWQTTATNYPRRSIFFGTTNEDSFLADPTGSRRWLPFEAGACDPDWIAANRDQLFAEGAHLFRANGVMFADAERLARDVHADFVNVDSWDDILGYWVDAPGFELHPPSASPFRLLDALTKGICLKPEQINRAAEMRAAASLLRLGFKRVQRRVEGRRQWFYLKPV